MKIVDVAEYYAEEGGGIKTYIQSKMRAGAEAASARRRLGASNTGPVAGTGAAIVTLTKQTEQ